MNPFGFLLKWFLRAIFHGVILSLLYIASDSILDTRGTDSPVGGPEAGSGYVGGCNALPVPSTVRVYSPPLTMLPF